MPNDDIIQRRAWALIRDRGRCAEEDETEDFIIGGNVQRLLDVSIVCRPGGQPAGSVAECGRGDDEVLSDRTA